MANRPRSEWRCQLFAYVVAFVLLTIALPDTLAATSSTIQDETQDTIQDETQAPTIQDGTEALEQDLALTAEATGWTVEEVKAHWLGDEVVDRLAGTIVARWPEIFIGSALSDQPYGPPTIYIKGAAPGEFLSLVAAEEVPVLVVDNQPFSFDELGQFSIEVHKALLTMGFDSVVTSFDLDGRGRIDANVTRKPGLPDDEDSIKAALPSHIRDSVNVTVSESPVVELAHALRFPWGDPTIRDSVYESFFGPFLVAAATIWILFLLWIWVFRRDRGVRQGTE